MIRKWTIKKRKKKNMMVIQKRIKNVKQIDKKKKGKIQFNLENDKKWSSLFLK